MGTGEIKARPWVATFRTNNYIVVKEPNGIYFVPFWDQVSMSTVGLAQKTPPGFCRFIVKRSESVEVTLTSFNINNARLESRIVSA